MAAGQDEDRAACLKVVSWVVFSFGFLCLELCFIFFRIFFPLLPMFFFFVCGLLMLMRAEIPPGALWPRRNQAASGNTTEDGGGGDDPWASPSKEKRAALCHDTKEVEAENADKIHSYMEFIVPPTTKGHTKTVL